MVRVKGDLFEVTCEGQYYGFTHGQKDIKSYTITAKLDENAKAAGFLSVFRNNILNNTKAMQSKYPDWKRYRTHVITETKNLSQANKPIKELALMNRTQIINYINHKGLGIDTDLYPDVSELRQALKDFRANRDQFIKQQDKRRLGKGPMLLVQQSVGELNPWLHNQTGQPEPQEAPEDLILDEDDENAITDFDDEDELDALIAGV